MEKSEQINELASALSKAQGIIIPASKDAENPFFKSKYADLASIWAVARDPLYKNGLAISQLPSADGNIVTIKTIMMHSSGQFISNDLTMVAKDSSPQAIGSCITYNRRYSLASVVGIASEEDDDGNIAQPDKGEKVEPKPINLRSNVDTEAKKHFKTPDEFKSWRVDNGLIEDIDKASQFDLAKLWNFLKTYKNA